MGGEAVVTPDIACVVPGVTVERFWSQVARAGDGECWIWKGQVRAAGYGVIAGTKRGNRPRKTAHRVAYELSVGTVLDTEIVKHLCESALCCNPRHLFKVARSTSRPTPFDARFWSNVQRSTDAECWLWQGRKNEHGYGIIGKRDDSGRWGSVLAHRASAELAGMHVAGFVVCHRCDNPPCVNPSHLFVGTMADNNADAVSKGRARVGVPKVTVDIRAEILRRSAAGESARSIARAIGLDNTTVADVVRKSREHEDCEHDDVFAVNELQAEERAFDALLSDEERARIERGEET